MRYQFLYGGQGAIDYAQEQLALVSNDEEREEWDEILHVLKKNKTAARGALNVGIMVEEELNKLYDQIAKFVGYAFNRSHSDVYADLGYRTAHSKKYYPTHFMAALLTMEDDPTKFSEHYAEVKRLGIPLLPPDARYSETGFTVEQQPDGVFAIRLGLVSIKNIGEKAANAIINARPFDTIQEFAKKIDQRVANKSVTRILIETGCFDWWTQDRHQCIVDYMTATGAKASTIPSYSAACTEAERLSLEKQHLGIYVSGHPFDGLPYQALATVKDGETFDIGGQIIAIKKHAARSGNMAFVTVETILEKIDITLFPKDWNANQDRIWKDALMIFRVRKEVKPDRTSYICEKVLLPKKSQLGDAVGAERPNDLPKRKTTKRAQMTLDDLGGAETKEDPLLDLFV